MRKRITRRGGAILMKRMMQRPILPAHLLDQTGPSLPRPHRPPWVLSLSPLLWIGHPRRKKWSRHNPNDTQATRRSPIYQCPFLYDSLSPRPLALYPFLSRSDGFIHAFTLLTGPSTLLTITCFDCALCILIPRVTLILVQLITTFGSAHSRPRDL